jgi:hypothetical protein
MSVEYITGSDLYLTGNLTVLGAITGNVTVTGSSFANVIDTSLTPYGFMYPGYSGMTAGLLLSTSAATNGQLLIGSTGVAPVAATLTGTANQITVTNGAGSITLGTPQSIGTSSSPTFTGLTLSGVTANSFIYSSGGGTISATSAPTNGQIMIGSTSNAPVLGTISGTSNEINVAVGPGTITLSTPQPIGTASNVTFGNVAVGSFTQNGFLYAGVSNLLTSTAVTTNGQLLIGATNSNPVAATLTGGAAISITNGAGSITINNTGVTSLIASTGISVSSTSGNVTISANIQYPTTTVTGANASLSTTTTYCGVNYAGQVTIDLPAGSSVGQGKVMVIKDESGKAATYNITVVANGSDVIDGNSSVVMAVNYLSLTLLWNTNHWSII